MMNSIWFVSTAKRINEETFINRKMELLDDDWVAVRHDVPNIIASKYNDFIDEPRSLGDDQIEVMVDESSKCILLFYFCEQNHEVKKFETRFQADSLSTLHFQMKTMIENFDVDPPSLAIATEYSGIYMLEILQITF